MDCKLLLWSGAGGLASSLTWQVKESRECWTEFTLKVTLQCRLPYLGEKTVRKNVLLLTSWPWQKVRPNSYNRLPPWCTYFFMYPYEHMTAMECKEVCIPLRCRSSSKVSDCAALLKDASFVLKTANTWLRMYSEREREAAREWESVHVVQLMLAILSLGSLTAAITAVGNLTFFFYSLTQLKDISFIAF